MNLARRVRDIVRYCRFNPNGGRGPFRVLRGVDLTITRVEDELVMHFRGKAALRTPANDPAALDRLVGEADRAITTLIKETLR